MLNTIYEMDATKRDIINHFNALLKSIDIVENNLKKIPSGNIQRLQNMKLRKKLVDYLLKGIDFAQAVEFLELDFYTTQETIENVLRVQYAILCRKNKLQNIYTARVMSAAGYTVKQIAGVIKSTPATVRNYLNNSL